MPHSGARWSRRIIGIAPVSKTGVPKGLVGSSPTGSAQLSDVFTSGGSFLPVRDVFLYPRALVSASMLSSKLLLVTAIGAPTST